MFKMTIKKADPAEAESAKEQISFVLKRSEFIQLLKHLVHKV